MLYQFFKILISSILILLISEISKRSSFIGAVLASIPLVSVLGIIWFYIDTKDTLTIISLSYSIFWLVIPSLSFFLLLPFFLKKNISFYYSLSLSVLIMIIVYFLMIKVLSKFGIQL
ncbi:MAG: hypothetical protein M0R46_11110 [Candidatus Muirbacterium halophilum]|nr:hypothetical protein [Candidatus Muirbacterium halophilum]MCK9476463.1 hypothetical protein [Candidatus Muirbacterium halophilum]